MHINRLKAPGPVALAEFKSITKKKKNWHNVAPDMDTRTVKKSRVFAEDVKK